MIFYNKNKIEYIEYYIGNTKPYEGKHIFKITIGGRDIYNTFNEKEANVFRERLIKSGLFIDNDILESNK